MASPAQIRANRANAQKSTGPRSEEGKRRSSRNALKHGFYAQSNVIVGECPDDLAALIADYDERFQPKGEIEEGLVRQLATAQWRLERISRLETYFLDRSINTEVMRWSEENDGDPNDDDNIHVITAGAVAQDARNEDILSKLSRYELRLTHRYNRALSRLAWLQDQRTPSTIASLAAEK